MINEYIIAMTKVVKLRYLSKLHVINKQIDNEYQFFQQKIIFIAYCNYYLKKILYTKILLLYINISQNVDYNI